MSVTPDFIGVCRTTKCILSLLRHNKDSISLPQKYIGLCSSPKFLTSYSLNNVVPVINYAPRLKCFKVV